MTHTLAAVLLATSLIVLANSREVRAQTSAASVKTAAPAAEHDGQHDFDFEFGSWKTHVKRLIKPLSGSTTWAEFDGTIVCRKVWGGRANMDEFDAVGPNGHIEGLTLRLYNPQSHQWSLYWANAKDGQPMVPATVGEWKNGRGEFFDQETFNGRSIIVRYVWSDITPTSARFEQSFSDDGGKTWEVNWIAVDTRVKDDPDKAR